jgi:hypothetical protein
MKSWCALAVGILLLLALAACNAAPGPSDGARPTDGATASEDLPPPDPVAEQMAGGWRRAPIVLDDTRIAVLSDACATAARQTFGEVEANLPTAVVDARGEDRATVILADDLDAVLCLARIDASGPTLHATVDEIDRLARTAVDAVDGRAIRLSGLLRLDDRSGGRTLAFGRIGPQAFQAKIGFDDATVVPGSAGDGWWAMWWVGGTRPASISAVDRNGLALGSAKVPDDVVDPREGPGTSASP